IVIACSGVFFTIVILLANYGSPMVVTSPEKANPFTSLESVPLRMLAGLLLVPMLFASIMGCGVHKAETRRRDLSLHPFFAIRSMSSRRLIAVKLKVAALSPLSAWLVMLGIALPWMLHPATDGIRTAPLGLILLQKSTPNTLLFAVVVLAILVLLTWKCQ